MYDEQAVAFVQRLDRLVRPKPEPAQRELGAVLNALEVHVEEGEGRPNIVTSFERLFLDIASLRKLDAKTIATAKKVLNDLRQYLYRETAGR
jgi:hypothetical protein